MVQWSERWIGTSEVPGSSLTVISFFFTKLDDDFPRRVPNEFRGVRFGGVSDDFPRMIRRGSEGSPRGSGKGTLIRAFPGKADTSGKGQEWSFRFREALLWVVLNFRAKKKSGSLIGLDGSRGRNAAL